MFLPLELLQTLKCLTKSLKTKGKPLPDQRGIFPIQKKTSYIQSQNQEGEKNAGQLESVIFQGKQTWWNCFDVRNDLRCILEQAGSDIRKLEMAETCCVIDVFPLL